jgi:hypothetical protein
LAIVTVSIRSRRVVCTGSILKGEGLSRRSNLFLAGRLIPFASAFHHSRAVSPTFRVALINLPALMRDIVELEFSRQPDFEVVPLATSIALRAATVSPALDAIVVGDQAGGGRPSGSDLLDVWPHAKVLVVSGGGRDATIVSLRHHRDELGHLDAQELVAAVRAALRRRPNGAA